MCLLLGPPGVGKTTTVHLVCRELGFSVVEFNASDTRNVKSIQVGCFPTRAWAIRRRPVALTAIPLRAVARSTW